MNELFAGALPKDVDQIAIQEYPESGNVPVLIPIPSNLSLDDDVVEDTLEGAGATQDSARIPVSLMWNFEVGGMPLRARSIMLGEPLSETGVAPNRVKSLAVHNNKTFPYFKLLMRAADNEGGDTLYTLPWCVLTSMSDDRSYGSFGRLPVSGRAVSRLGVDSAGYIQTREVAQAIVGEIPAEYANRPFGLRAAAVARTWHAAHVWRKYEFDPPDQISIDSDVAVAQGSKTAISLNHYDISTTGFVVSEQSTLASPITDTNYTLEYRDTGTGITAAIAGVGTGITISLTDYVPGTLQVTRTGRSGAGDYTVQDSVTVSPDTSGDWVLYPDTGHLVREGQTAGETVYYTIDLKAVRVTFETGASVAVGDTVYFQYRPSQEIKLRNVGGMQNLAVYKGSTESLAVVSNQITNSAIRIQRGLADKVYDGSLWLRTADVGARPILAAEDNLIIVGTGVARKSAAVVMPNTCSYSFDMREYTANASDRLSEFSARVNMVSLNLEAFGFDLDVIEIMTGVRATTSGQDTAKQALLHFNMGVPSPFFTLVRQSTSSESTDGARDVFPRVKITSWARPQNQGEFNMFNVGLNGIGSEAQGADQNVFMRIEQHETISDIDLDTI